jgi:hypothetical protein
MSSNKKLPVRIGQYIYWDFHSSGVLYSADLYLYTNILGQLTGLTFKGQAVQEELGIIIPEDGTDGLSLNVSN